MGDADVARGGEQLVEQGSPLLSVRFVAGVTVGSRNTCYRAARFGLTRTGLAPVGLHQLLLAPSETRAAWRNRGDIAAIANRLSLVFEERSLGHTFTGEDRHEATCL